VYEVKKSLSDQQKTTTTSGTSNLKLNACNDTIKALHIEINKHDPPAFKAQIKALYSSLVTTFLLGIKMHLVCNYKQVTNVCAKEKAK